MCECSFDAKPIRKQPQKWKDRNLRANTKCFVCFVAFIFNLAFWMEHRNDDIYVSTPWGFGHWFIFHIFEWNILNDTVNMANVEMSRSKHFPSIVVEWYKQICKLKIRMTLLMKSELWTKLINNNNEWYYWKKRHKLIQPITLCHS